MNLNDLFGTIEYAPHVGQLRFHESDARFKVLIAGARFGKSLAASKDVLRDLLGAESRGWLVGPTYGLARPEFEYVLGDAQRRLGLAISASHQSARDWAMAEFANNCQVHCLSTHYPQSLLGREVDWIVLCEAAHIDREAYERFLRARLATREGRLLVPTTPRGRNWIVDLYERGLGGQPLWESFRFATWDNPSIAASEIEAARQELAAEVFDEQYGGAFVARAGRVYTEFEPAVHVMPARPEPGTRFWHGVDFGFTNPFVCLWVALDADDRLLVFDEHCASRLTLAAHAQEIRRRDDEWRAQGLICAGGVADPAGRDQREELGRLGVTLNGAENGLLAGINAVRQRLAPRPDGTRGLRIDPRCVNLVREFESYCFEDAAGGDEALPHKRNDHCLDALRYLCLALGRRVGWQGVAPV